MKGEKKTLRYCQNNTSSIYGYTVRRPVVSAVAEAIDKEYPIAMAYVPWQKWCNVMNCAEGFACGTIFSELVKPFTGCRGRRGTNG